MGHLPRASRRRSARRRFDLSQRGARAGVFYPEEGRKLGIWKDMAGKSDEPVRRRPGCRRRILLWLLLPLLAAILLVWYQRDLPRRTVEMLGLLDAGGSRVDLQGRAVVPGLIDTHLHFASYGRRLSSVNVQEVPTQDDALARVAERVAESSPGVWVQGGGWMHVAADGAGNWAADFSGMTDITYPSDGGSSQTDGDGDWTFVWWTTPDIIPVEIDIKPGKISGTYNRRA